MVHTPKHSKILLHLSKPWELGEALGWSDLPASVGRRRRDGWLVELEQPFRYHDAEYRYFLVSPRLEGSDLSDADSFEVPCRLVPLSSDAVTSENAGNFDAEDVMTGSVTDYAA